MTARCRVCKTTAGPYVPAGRITRPDERTSGPSGVIVFEVCEDCYDPTAPAGETSAVEQLRK